MLASTERKETIREFELWCCVDNEGRWIRHHFKGKFNNNQRHGLWLKRKLKKCFNCAEYGFYFWNDVCIPHKYLSKEETNVK